MFGSVVYTVVVHAYAGRVDPPPPNCPTGSGSTRGEWAASPDRLTDGRALRDEVVFISAGGFPFQEEKFGGGETGGSPAHAGRKASISSSTSSLAVRVDCSSAGRSSRPAAESPVFPAQAGQPSGRQRGSPPAGIPALPISHGEAFFGEADRDAGR